MGFETVTIHKHLGRRAANNNVVCRFWREGKCNRKPCKFLHGDLPAPARGVYRRTLKQQSCALPEGRVRKGPHATAVATAKEVTGRTLNYGTAAQTRKRLTSFQNFLVLPAGDEGKTFKKSFNHGTEDLSMKRPNPKHGLVSAGEGDGFEDVVNQQSAHSGTKVVDLKKARVQQKCIDYSPRYSEVLTTEDAMAQDKTAQKDKEKTQEHWMSGDGFSMLAKLYGHTQAINGIALPVGSDELYSGGNDGTVRVWNCHTGQSAKVINLGDKIGSLISEGPWVFVGMPNLVKAWNIETAADFSLTGPVGQVYAMVVACNLLFAGAQNGVILVWKGCIENPKPFQLAASMKGHTSAIMCLAVGAMRLYSGSMDCTIRVWNLETLQCIQTLDGHSDAVMSLICWDRYLLSCSLDQTIKVWFPAEGGNLEVTYAHHEEHGAVALCGVNDAEAKPILLCSHNGKSVHLYELPSFCERGKIFSKQAVRAIQLGPGGLFFTGDGTGVLTVWKFAEQSGAISQVE